MSSVAVRCAAVSKRFRIYEHRAMSLRETFIRVLLRKQALLGRPYFALGDIDFTIEKGEAVALIGTNGSGKSTILRVIAGIYPPSDGEVQLSGRLAAVLELGAGFHPDLTGTENVAIYGTALGLSRQEIRERFREILDFADIGQFIDTPVKYYSSGMVARLAFAVAVCVEPDILLLDEVLSVGDETFRDRCFERLRRFHAHGGTLIFVSHDLETVREMCTRAIWMDQGAVRMDSEVNEVVDAYLAHA